MSRVEHGFNSRFRPRLYTHSQHQRFYERHLDLFDVICKQHHRTAFNPFLTGTTMVILTVRVNKPLYTRICTTYSKCHGSEFDILSSFWEMTVQQSDHKKGSAVRAHLLQGPNHTWDLLNYCDCMN